MPGDCHLRRKTNLTFFLNKYFDFEKNLIRIYIYLFVLFVRDIMQPILKEEKSSNKSSLKHGYTEAERKQHFSKFCWGFSSTLFISSVERILPLLPSPPRLKVNDLKPTVDCSGCVFFKSGLDDDQILLQFVLMISFFSFFYNKIEYSSLYSHFHHSLEICEPTGFLYNSSSH